MSEFTLPDFLSGTEPEEIHQRMMNALPEDIDDMPGGFPWDFTFPTALIASQLLNFQLPRTLMLMYPQYAWGEWLDLHGVQAGVYRKTAGKAAGKIKIEGEAGTVIPEGFVVCTEATADAPSLAYRTEKEALIGEEGHVEIPILAEAAGTAHNVRSGTIRLSLKSWKGITGIENPEPVTGGTEQETDEAYRTRILEAFAGKDVSYIGNDTDYIRWAKEVTGIGDCIVIPAWNGPGTVKLVLIDSNGAPANEHLLQEVYEHIVSPADRSKRLLPTACADLTVTAASTVQVTYQCHGLKFDHTTDLEQIKKDFCELLKPVYTEAKQEGILRYNQVRPVVTDIPGVEDFDTFLMQGAMENIVLSKEEYPETGDHQLDFAAKE